jgi:hypothetical protein
MQRISFTCRACAWDSAGDAPELHQPPWAQLSGYDGCAGWLAAAPTHDGEQPLLDRTPSPGEVHWLTVRLPFAAEVGAPFCCVYRPPLSFYNGWTEHMEDLGRSAIVRGIFRSVHDAGPERATIRASVTDVRALTEIGSSFPPQGRIGASFWEGFATQTFFAVEWREFVWVHGSFEGDVATSGLFEMRGGRRHLVLGSFSSHHADFVFIGNSPLDGEAESTLQEMLARGR